MDLVALESEVMLTGKWQNFEELEASLSIDELLALLKAVNKREYDQRRFFAALQGVDLDKQTGNSSDQEQRIPMYNGEVDVQAMVERKHQEYVQEQIKDQSGGQFVADDAAQLMALPGIEYG